MSWIILIFAGLLETVWALALKESQGFSKLGLTVLFVVTIVVSMVLLVVAVRELAVGTGYAVWTGIERSAPPSAGMLWFGDPGAARQTA